MVKKLLLLGRPFCLKTTTKESLQSRPAGGVPGSGSDSALAAEGANVLQLLAAMPGLTDVLWPNLLEYLLQPEVRVSQFQGFGILIYEKRFIMIPCDSSPVT